MRWNVKNKIIKILKEKAMQEDSVDCWFNAAENVTWMRPVEPEGTENGHTSATKSALS